MVTDRRFYRQDGLNTKYALHCGYVDIYEDADSGIQITRWQEGGTAYHVRIHDFGTIARAGKGRLLWETFSKPEESARFYKRMRTSIKRLTPLDGRFTVQLEHTGKPTPQWVLRAPSCFVKGSATGLDVFAGAYPSKQTAYVKHLLLKRDHLAK